MDDSQKRFTSAYYSKPGVLYFVAAGNPPCAIKIGVSTSDGFARRLRALQSANHERIEVLGLIRFEKSTYSLPMREAERRERALHGQFRTHCRAKPGSVGHEWFDPAPELLQYIREAVA